MIPGKFTSFRWVYKVITSCETADQLENAENLITNFDRLYKDNYLRKELAIHLGDRWMYSLLNQKL
jgi:hypothetical protein